MEISNRYTTLKYEYPNLAEKFAYKIDCRVEDLAKALEHFVEATEVALGMFPDNLHIEIYLLPDRESVIEEYAKTHSNKFDSLAYYSKTTKAIYISVRDTTDKILVHELAHGIVHAFFSSINVPPKIHELLAQYAEEHVRLNRLP